MKKGQKIKVVERLKDKVAKAKSLVLADYRGLTHRQLEEIKKAMRAVGADFVVTKNTLLRKAMEHGTWNMEQKQLEGPTATLFSYQDEIAPLSILAKFIKNFGLPQVKIGILDNKVLTSTEILQIAALPSREILMSILVARLKSPMYRLHYSLNYNVQKLAMVLKAKTNSASS